MRTHSPTMATINEPLLSPPTRKASLTCKALTLTLSLAPLICLAGILALQLPTTKHYNILQPSDLCAGSPNPSACSAIVSDAITNIRSSGTHPIRVLQTVLRQSIYQLDTATAVTASIYHRIDVPKHQSAITDCIHLLDLSRDRLVDSVSSIATGAYADARTWLSAVLTNHVTCLDGLTGTSSAPVKDHLETLTAMASASLAVLNAVTRYNGDVIKPVTEFPTWVTVEDRKLLEALSADGIQANVVVAKDGSGDYETVQDAVNSAPNKGTSRYVIYVKNGTYEENVQVGKKKTNVTVVGDGLNSTIITGSRNVIDGSTTFRSATLAAVGDGFILQDICVENTAGPEKHQAVALRVGADRSVINRCKIDGYQDTLYAHSLRQFYRDSLISGTVDFIFGNAAVVFQNCSLIARLPMSNQQNMVTAQGRIDPNQNTGTSIQNCQVVPSSDLVPMEEIIPTYLGRPWKNFSRTVYMESYIDNHVDPKGWHEWDGDFALDTLYYGEFANVGPGAGTEGRVNWTGYHVITDPNVAKKFSVAEFIQGGAWLPSTGVAFKEGL